MTLAYFHWAICVYVRRKYGPKDELEAGGRYNVSAEVLGAYAALAKPAQQAKPAPRVGPADAALGNLPWLLA